MFFLSKGFYDIMYMAIKSKECRYTQSHKDSYYEPTYVSTFSMCFFNSLFDWTAHVWILYHIGTSRRRSNAGRKVGLRPRTAGFVLASRLHCGLCCGVHLRKDLKPEHIFSSSEKKNSTIQNGVVEAKWRCRKKRRKTIIISFPLPEVFQYGGNRWS